MGSPNTRNRLIDAMIALVSERGYAETTAQLVSRTAGLPSTAFHEHFASKEDCFLAAFDREVEGARLVVVERLDPTLPWPERTAAAIEILLDLIAAEPDGAYLCLVAARSAGASAAARYRAALEAVAADLRKGRQAWGIFASRLPESLEGALAGGGAWLIERLLAAGEAQRLRDLSAEVAQLVLMRYVSSSTASSYFSTATRRPMPSPGGLIELRVSSPSR